MAKLDSMKKLLGAGSQVGTSDSTSYYGRKAYVASLKYALADGRDMNKYAKEQDQANADKLRQKNKGKSGYDANGFPIKK